LARLIAAFSLETFAVKVFVKGESFSTDLQSSVNPLLNPNGLPPGNRNKWFAPLVAR
jgi:hypothetical protein